MNNKEVAEILTTYFLKQDHEIISKCLSHTFIDLNRFLTLTTTTSMSEEDKNKLIDKTRINMNGIYEVLKGNHKEGIKLVNYNNE